ncbi:VOC family protein, partial [Ralstonia solanacearum]|nr:VOC family protein [Ralstonia solanacearum]MDB0558531.1 VOC family protein [Ralstonia solanacearum]
MAVKPIPEGYHSVTPYLSIKGAGKALDFYKQAFGATEIMRMAGPNGTIAHAEIRIGDSPVMMADEVPNMSCASPDTLQSTSVGL